MEGSTIKHIGNSFTLKYFREAFITPEMLEYLIHEQLKAKGEKSMDQRCREKAAEILAACVPPPIDPALKTAVDAFVARRQAEISPAIS